MKQRCTNPKDAAYKDYGSQGIKVCERWRESFENFYEDMGPRPSKQHSIGRVDNDGNYEPTNCRWETDEEQNRNRAGVRNVTYNGKTQCLAAWEKECGIPANVLGARLDMGWDEGRAFTEPVHHRILTPEEVLEIRRRYHKGSFTDGAPALGREFGVSYQTIIRIANGEIKRYNGVA